MFERYKALFTLRNRGGPEELEALTAVFKASRCGPIARAQRERPRRRGQS